MDRPLILLAAIFAAETAPNVAPPPEMEAFSFMIGARECAGVWRRDGAEEPFSASWRGQKLLDGHLIVEEYKAWFPDGEVFVAGVNTRVFDAKNRRWSTWWLSAIDDVRFELGQPSFSETEKGGREVVFIIGEGDNLQRATYRVAPDGRLAWSGEASADGGATWNERVMVINCGPAS
ncbi:MAG: hypothetical protein ACE5FO_01200 [Parvularculaceae bacterium]